MQPIIIIGSGFAAYQLVKTIRRQNTAQAITVITADNGDDYNKPDLSHVFTREQIASDLITATATDFAQQHHIELISNTRVESIDKAAHTLVAGGTTYHYSKLVLATGAQTFVPPMQGNATDTVMTLNSLQEYQRVEADLEQSRRILLIGGGLIGVEFAMDLASSGKEVIVVDPSAHLLSNLLPDFVAVKVEDELRKLNVTLESLNTVTSVDRCENGVRVKTAKQHEFLVDQVISVAGLKSNTQLAQQSGLAVERGIVVNSQMQTSAQNIYAIGDCAQINGRVMAFLQPIVVSANTLAKNLLGEHAELSMPAMMVKVKTPSYPIQLSGLHDEDSLWQIEELSNAGIIARAFNRDKKMTAFVVTNEHVKQAFPLFRELQTQG